MASNAHESFQFFLQLLGWDVSLGKNALLHAGEFEVLGVVLELHLLEVPGFVKMFASREGWIRLSVRFIEPLVTIMSCKMAGWWRVKDADTARSVASAVPAEFTAVSVEQVASALMSQIELYRLC
eukprot:217121-Amphidinium_carterae.3